MLLSVYYNKTYLVKLKRYNRYGHTMIEYVFCASCDHFG